MNIAEIVEVLETEKQRIEAALTALSGSPQRKITKRTMSQKARMAISRAQKKRWKAKRAEK